MAFRSFNEMRSVNILIGLDRNKVIEVAPYTRLRVLSKPNGQERLATKVGWS